MPVPDQPAESDNASTGDRTESEAASAILASVKEQVGTERFLYRASNSDLGRLWPHGSCERSEHVCHFNISVRV